MKRLKLWLLCLCVMIAALILVFIPKQQKLTIGIFAGSNWNVPSSASDDRIENAIAAFNEIYPDVKVEFQSGIRPELYEVNCLAKSLMISCRMSSLFPRRCFQCWRIMAVWLI